MESSLITPKASDQQKKAEASDQSSLITPKASDQQKKAEASDQSNLITPKASDQQKRAKASDQPIKAKASDQQKREKAHELAVAELHKITDELAIELHKAAVSILVRTLLSGRLDLTKACPGYLGDRLRTRTLRRSEDVGGEHQDYAEI